MSTQSNNGFDLQTAAPIAEQEDQGLVVQIRDAFGNPLTFTDDAGEHPVTMTVAGTYSNRYRRAREAQTTRQLKRRSTNLTGDLVNSQRIGVVADCVLAWSGFMSGGKPLACDKEHVFQVLKHAPWILEQVESAMEDHEAFFDRS